MFPSFIEKIWERVNFRLAIPSFLDLHVKFLFNFTRKTEVVNQYGDDLIYYFLNQLYNNYRIK